MAKFLRHDDGGRVVHRGRRVEVGPGGVRVGREPDNDLVVDDDAVSRHHAVIRADGARLVVEDLGSTNGTVVDGETIRGEARAVEGGTTVVIGRETIRCVLGGETAVTDFATREGGWIVPLDGRLTPPCDVGFDDPNDATCDVVFDDPNVSRFHAEVVPLEAGAVEVRDLGSANGIRVDGRFAGRARLQPGASVGIGPFRLAFGAQGLAPRDDRCDVRLQARDVTARAGGRTILEPASRWVEPGELVAVIGRSGAGRTTLVKAMAGVLRPTAGEVLLTASPWRTASPMSATCRRTRSSIRS